MEKEKIPFQHKVSKYFITPVTLPIISFALLIFIGTIFLKSPWAVNDQSISWLDALFTATSATCVTGLVVVDTGSYFSTFGQTVILIMIQLGGLGIMTYTSLVLYLWRQKISLSDHMIVGRQLLHDPKFKLGRFLLQIVFGMFLIETIGAFSLWYIDSNSFPPYSAIFHSVSAFCNAGFALQNTSLIKWQDNFFINIVFIILIILGSVGFVVIFESYLWCKSRLLQHKTKYRMSWHAIIVIETTIYLIAGGCIFIFFSELSGGNSSQPTHEIALMALFQSVTPRTAGFNTVEISLMTNVSLVVIMLLMVIGGSPGSCAGGIKTTTFRTFIAFIFSQIHGRSQTVMHNNAVDENQVSRALTLGVMYFFVIALSGLLLTISEGGNAPHPEVRGFFIEILFEVISALGTVGLSMGITENLSSFGKSIIIILMFIGRLGPIIFLTTLQSWQHPPHYRWVEKNIMIG